MKIVEMKTREEDGGLRARAREREGEVRRGEGQGGWKGEASSKYNVFAVGERKGNKTRNKTRKEAARVRVGLVLVPRRPGHRNDNSTCGQVL